MVNLFRWVAVAIVACTIGGIALYYYAISRVDEQLRERVEHRLAGYFPQLDVRVRSARLIPGEGIEIRGITIGARDSRGEDAWLTVEDLLLPCDVTLSELARERLEITRLVVRRARLVLAEDAGGHWNWDEFGPKVKGESGPLPKVEIQNSEVELRYAPGDTRTPLVFRDVQLQLAPASSSPASASAATSGGGAPAALTGTAPAASAPAVMQLTGSCSGEYARRLQFAASLSPVSGRWALHARVDDCYLSDGWFARLPPSCQEQAAPLAALRGHVSGELKMSNPEAGQSQPQFAFTASLQRGQLADGRLPYPLTDLSARCSGNGGGLVLEELSARCGAGSIRASGRRTGLNGQGPWSVQIAASRVALDQNLEGVLPEQWRRMWRRFSPEGTLNAAVSLAYDGNTLKPDISAECLDVSLVYDKFRYPLTRTTGHLQLRDNNLYISLRGQAGGDYVRIDGQLASPGAQATGAINVRAETSLAIDEQLLSALDETTQRTMRSLEPRGRLGVEAAFQFSGQGEKSVEKRVLLRMLDCELKYERFPYALNQVRGVIEIAGGRWNLRDLEARHGSGYLSGGGSLAPAAAGGTEFSLQLVGTDIPLNDELRSALSAPAQRVWSSIRPQGTLDHLKLHTLYRSRDKEFLVDLRAQKWPQQQNVEGRAVSIEPTFFRYRLDQLTGAIRYRNGRFDLEEIKAQHGNVNISAVGDCELRRDGSWQVRFDRLTADRLRADRELISALPPQLGQAINRLSPSGPINLDGSLEFAGSTGAGEPIAARWSLGLDLENGTLATTPPLEHIHGGVRLDGDSRGEQFRCRGELNVDSLVCREVQLTQVRGPLWIDRQKVLLGGWASPQDSGKPPRFLTAQIWDGSLSGSAQMELGEENRFAIDAGLDRADVAWIARESLSGRRNIGGRASGRLQLQGTTKGPHTWEGQGFVRLRDADIYELPVMVSMLKLLSIKPPDRTAFTTSDIDYHVRGEHVYFDKIDFNGDAISLKGNGEMGLDHEINVNFYTLMGNNERTIPVIQPLLGAASRQVMLIRVTGTAEQPKLTREAFPGINETIKELFPELAKK